MVGETMLHGRKDGELPLCKLDREIALKTEVLGESI